MAERFPALPDAVPRLANRIRASRSARSGARLRSWRCAASLLLLLAAGAAIGHADYASSDPERDAVVDTAPDVVDVAFTESVETRFSLFKAYRLEHPSLDDASLSPPDFLRLNGLAAILVGDVLQLRDDSEARADLGLVDAPARTDAVTLRLRPELGPGAYVVMWRVLAEDTHPTQGHFVFVVTPEDGAP